MSAWVLENAAVAAVLAVVVALAAQLLGKRPAVCHALWLLVVVKLLMPPVPLWNLRGLSFLPAQDIAVFDRSAPRADRALRNGRGEAPETIHAVRVVSISLASPGDNVAAVSESLGFGEGELEHDAPAAEIAIEPSTRDFAAEARTSPALSVLLTTLTIVWAAGAAVAVIIHMRRVLQLRRVINDARAPAAWLEAEVQTLARQLCIKPPHIRVCKKLPCPMVVGLPRATLLWPAHLDERLDRAALPAVIAHELAHLKRRDHWTVWIEVMAACAWWWHPAVWIARREIRQYAELACDAWVVAQAPSARSQYAKALIDVCEFISQAKISAAPAVAMARGARRSFERRLTMILKQRISAPVSYVAWLVVVVVAVFVLPGFSTGQDEWKPDDSSARAETTSDPVKAANAPLKPVVAVEVEDPAATESTPVDQPPTAIERGLDSLRRADPAKLVPSDGTSDKLPPALATTRRSDEFLLKQVAPNRRAIRLERNKGRPLDAKQIENVAEVLMPLVKRMRAQLRNSRADEYIVNEIYLHMLDRMPTASESKIWIDQLKQNDDAAVRILVAALGQSAEFSGAEATFRRLAHNPKVQTLLRVSYEMPADKANALAAFIKENVLQPIDVRVVEPGLIVTAEGEVQAPIAAMVSLITGERIVLDLDQHAKSAPYPTAAYADRDRATISGPYGPPTMEGYLPRTADGSRAGIFPPGPKEAGPAKQAPASYDPRPVTSEATTAKEPAVVVPGRP